MGTTSSFKKVLGGRGGMGDRTARVGPDRGSGL